MHLSEGACAPMVAVIERVADYIDGPIEQASIAELLGGPVYLIEHVAELAEIRSVEEREGVRVSLADDASGWFDIAEWIDGGHFARFATIETADGGPQFIVPRHIADRAASVAQSIDRFAARGP